MTRRPLSRLIAVALAVAAVAAPSALAMPTIDLPTAPSKTPAASQDLRSPDATDPMVHAGRTAAVAPTWPADPKPITASQPSSTDNGGGSSVLPVALAILAAACLAMFAGRRLMRPRLRPSRT
jgi:hypothetical protein